MKNKYQKLHRIVIGKPGSGKSFYILSNVKEDNKINIICYPEAIGTYGDVYRKAFPGIFLKYRQDVITAIPQHITSINENTLLKCNHHYSSNIFKFIEWAKQYGEDLSRYRFVFLDSLWNQLNQDTVNKVFTRFKGKSGTEVRDSFIKPNIVSWTKEVVAKYKVSDIIGSKREDVNMAITDYLADKFADYNISISNVSLSNVEVDEDTRKAIDAKIAAQQNAETQAIQNQTNIDKAKADAEAKVTAAQGDADAKVIAAQAEADANAKINSSITDQLIRMKEAEARLKHGWVTVQGSDTVVTKDADKDSE